MLRIHNMSRFWTLSPDGTRVVRNNTAGPNRDMWIENLTNGTSVRLTQSNDNYSPIWSSDGKWLCSHAAFLSRISIDGRLTARGVEERLTNDEYGSGPEEHLSGRHVAALPGGRSDVRPGYLGAHAAGAHLEPRGNLVERLNRATVHQDELQRRHGDVFAERAVRRVSIERVRPVRDLRPALSGRGPKVSGLD